MFALFMKFSYRCINPLTRPLVFVDTFTFLLFYIFVNLPRVALLKLNWKNSRRSVTSERHSSSAAVQ